MNGRLVDYPERAKLPALFKVTGPNGEPLNGGNGAWPLPFEDADGWHPGEWRSIDAEYAARDPMARVDLEPCRVGLHVTDAAHITTWLPTGSRLASMRLWRVEIHPDSEIIDAGGKYVVRTARLLPHPADRVPNVHMGDMHAARALARVKAERAYDRAMRGINEQMASAMRDVRLPIGHPMRAQAETFKRAYAEREAAYVKADKRFSRTYDREFARMLSVVGA